MALHVGEFTRRSMAIPKLWIEQMHATPAAPVRRLESSQLARTSSSEQQTIGGPIVQARKRRV